MYIFFYLELALKKKKDRHVYAFINVSEIPNEVLIKIFDINIAEDPNILEGYFLKKSKYKEHKKYIQSTIGHVDLSKFKYVLRQYAGDDESSVRKMYKLSLME